MILGKYHIVIFKNSGKGGSRNLYLRGWLGIVGVLGIIALIGCNIWLWIQYTDAAHTAKELAKTEKSLEEQRGQIYSLIDKLRLIANDVKRVQQFDAKLRIMMNMDQDPTQIGAVGGALASDFTTSYPLMHRQELVTRKMQSFLKQLAEDVQLEEVQQQALLHALRSNRDKLISMPSIWPAEGLISSRFGGRASPFGRGSEFHKGLDIKNRAGTPITAPAFGYVIQAEASGAYGNTIEIDHGNGIITKFAHLQSFTIKKGQSVKRGDTIGYMGSTGRSTGPHLHYEVRLNGVNIDPMRYILN